MAWDQTKTFTKKNADLIPRGGDCPGRDRRRGKGGGWRRGMAQASTLGSAVVDLRDQREGGRRPPDGEAARLPESAAFWLGSPTDSFTSSKER